MIDLHCHILPGVDDGSPDLQTSLRMAQMAVDDGVSHIVATPHVKHEGVDDMDLARQVAQLNGQLLLHGIPLTVLTGGDVVAALPPQLAGRFTINNTPYILLEFPHSHLPAEAEKTLFEWQAAGLRPIITHPERNPTILRNPDRLRHLVEVGALVQVTAGSLTGEFGQACRACAIYLLEAGLVHFLASDGHSSEFRKPLLSHGQQLAAGIIGEGPARALVTTNPEAVIFGKDFHV
ncbi:CpsB/CapC family capsule biosynthesis tyrosine phosphatase [Desulfuromonas sp. CSMB_57]|jgi:protein-tyrosine phosphatase|uniref:tyrosine-protein phosphatase n=1 Tax=Desulfuromonas sp. CSMB_57 TaxID=2807629 RepID=UPI001CD74F52|nr:CpsB/CapC family capsule biosynthesis tyrosine phosphatase [Desulfuromonas sp. CSMB_57]